VPTRAAIELPATRRELGLPHGRQAQLPLADDRARIGRRSLGPRKAEARGWGQNRWGLTPRAVSADADSLPLLLFGLALDRCRGGRTDLDSLGLRLLRRATDAWSVAPLPAGSERESVEVEIAAAEERGGHRYRRLRMGCSFRSAAVRELAACGCSIPCVLPEPPRTRPCCGAYRKTRSGQVLDRRTASAAPMNASATSRGAFIA